MDQHIAEIEGPVKPSRRATVCDIDFKTRGKLGLHLFSVVRRAGDLIETRACSLEIGAEDIHRQRCYTNDDSGEAVEGRGQSPDNASLVNPNEFGAELFERTADSRC